MSSSGSPERQRHSRHRLTNPVFLARPSGASRPERLPLRLDDPPVRGQPLGPQHVGVPSGGAVEGVELGGELELGQATRQRHGRRAAGHAGPVVEVADPMEDVGDPPVAVVDIAHRRFAFLVTPLGERDDHRPVTGVDQVTEGVEQLVHTVGPLGCAAVVHEAAAPAEGGIHPLAPRGFVESEPEAGGRTRRQPVVEPRVTFGLLEHDGSELSCLEGGQVLTNIGVRRAGIRRAAGLDLAGDDQGDRDRVLAALAGETDRARARPHQPATVDGELDPVRPRHERAPRRAPR